MQPADTAPNRDRQRRPLRLPALAAVAALIALALLVAGCGGGGHSPGVADATNSHTTTSDTSSASGGSAAGGGSGPSTSSGGGGSGPQSGFAIAGGDRATALKLSQCMRANGVPNFPDPNGQGVIQGTGFNPSSASFQAAMNKCRKYAPNGGQPPSPAQQAQFEADALKFSKCMRSHGVPGFPDPSFKSSGGGFSIRISAHAGSGVDPSSPIYQAAQKACQPDLPFKGKAAQSAAKQ